MNNSKEKEATYAIVIVILAWIALAVFFTVIADRIEIFGVVKNDYEEPILPRMDESNEGRRYFLG